jgi:hydroxypyruvate isomerase
VQAARERKAAGTLRDYSDWVFRCAERKRLMHRKSHYTETPIKPMRVYEEINKVFDRNTVYVTTIGLSQIAAAQFLNVYGPRQWINCGQAGPLGWTIPAALGVVAADPTKNVVGLSGDYDFQFLIEELAVGAQFRLPYVQVLVNNSYLGLIRQAQRSFEMDYCVQLAFENQNIPEPCRASPPTSRCCSTKCRSSTASRPRRRPASPRSSSCSRTSTQAGRSARTPGRQRPAAGAAQPAGRRLGRKASAASPATRIASASSAQRRPRDRIRRPRSARPQVNCLAGIAPKDVRREAARHLRRQPAFRRGEAAAAGIRLLIEPINTFDIPALPVPHAQALDLIASRLRTTSTCSTTSITCSGWRASWRQHDQGRPAAIAHMQLADNPGRNEPGTGEINYRFLFGWLDAIGYPGWIGCEYKPKTTTEAGLGWRAAHGL